jgi:hypothetical protein
MKASVYTRYGSPDVLRLMDMEKRRAEPSSVRVVITV